MAREWRTSNGSLDDPNEHNPLSNPAQRCSCCTSLSCKGVAMMDTIPDPVAEAVVHWRTPEEGGRRSGPSTTPVYTATTVFVLGGETEVQPGWPQTADPKLSAWAERTAVRADGSWVCARTRDYGRPHGPVVPGLLTEGDPPWRCRQNS